jgi:hypothetical protein
VQYVCIYVCPARRRYGTTGNLFDVYAYAYAASDLSILVYRGSLDTIVDSYDVKITDWLSILCVHIIRYMINIILLSVQ